MKEIYIVGKRGWRDVPFTGILPYDDVLGFFFNKKSAIAWVEEQRPQSGSSEYYYATKIENLDVN